MTTGRSSRLSLVAAIVVLVAGLIRVAVHDDRDTRPTRASPTTTTTTPRTTTSTSALVTTTATAAPTTVRSAVPSPEAATNGLWAAYAANNASLAKRFATDDVVSTLFEQPFDGATGTFQGCSPAADGTFDCVYLQPSTRYAMTAQARDDGSFEIVHIEVTPIS